MATREDDKEYILSCFGKTQKMDNDLILVVGREPNNDVDVDNLDGKIGTYDWQDHPHCFWAVAQEVAAWMLKIDPYRFKDRCYAKKTSPILLTNAMPFSVLDRVGAQGQVRKSTTTQNKREHLENLLKHKDILKRVKAVWFCGLDNKEYYKEFTEGLVEHFKNSVEYVELPFLSRRYKESILNSIEKERPVKTMAILEKFMLD